MSDFAQYALIVLLVVVGFVFMDVVFPYILQKAIDDGTDER